MSPRPLPSCALLALLASCSSLGHTSDPAPHVRGPLATRQQHPLGLTLMAFRPRRPVTQDAGELGAGVTASLSSIEEIQRFPPYNPNDSVVMDAETIRTVFRGRYGVSESVDVEVELPFLYASGGVLDKFIEDFHEFFNLPDGGRDENVDDDYRVDVISGSDELYALEGNRLGVQDIPIFVTWQLQEETEGAPAFALRAGLELPTGSESRGFGNGALDVGAGVLGEKSFGRWTVVGGMDVVFPGQSDRMEASPGNSYETLFAFELGGEYRWNDRVSLVAGTKWTSPMIASVELEEIDREIFDLGVGALWDVGDHSRFALSFHEDLVAATGSDFTVHLGYTWNY